MVIDVGAIVLLGLLAWKVSQLLEIQKKVHIELVTARWHTHERVRALERDVESERQGSLAFRGEPGDRL